MNDPYQVLGVPETASDDEVKRAYREMARKYHPDNYHDNPLADLAEEKMKDINAAYEEITRRRTGSGSPSYGGSSGTYGGGSGTYSGGSGYGASGNGGSSYRTYGERYGGSLFQQVRLAIQSGNLSRAEQLLSHCSDHNAEWNFLMGALYARRGWMDEARRCYRNAVEMDPSNAEYRQALNYMEQGPRSVWGSPFGTDLCCGVDAPCLPFWCCFLPLCC